jgi:DNA invertase Pin-like site-specific DNA recombinase
MMHLQYNEHPKRGVIYARVSSDSQDVNNSIEAQIAECQDFAKRNNITIVKTYIDEAETGLINSRIQFQEMMHDATAKEKPFDFIIVWKFSRFSRDKFDNTIYKNRLQRRGIRIISIKEPIDDSPAGQMMENMIESMDAFYSANLSQDVRRGQRQVALRGYYPGNWAPYGYKIKKVQEEGGKAFHNTFEPDPPYDAIVRRMFLEAGAGRSISEIRDGLIADGITAAKGGKWNETSIHQMLHNLHYAGFIVWGSSSKSGDPPVIAEGKHEPIVSKEEFDLASQVLAAKFHDVINPRHVSSEYMLTSMLCCGICGDKLTGMYSKHAGIRYYVCPRRKRHAIAGCELPFVNVAKCDQEVLSVILDDLLSPENLEAAMGMIAKELSGPYEQQATTVRALEDQIRKVLEQQERVMQAYEAGAYTVTDFAKRMEPLRRSEAELSKKKADAESDLDQQAAVIANPQMVLAFAKDVGQFIKNSTAKERKQVLKKFVKTVWVHPGRIKIIYSIPLPRDVGKSNNSDEEPGPFGDPVSSTALLSLHSRPVKGPSSQSQVRT